jgi:hypothetical protein
VFLQLLEVSHRLPSPRCPQVLLRPRLRSLRTCTEEPTRNIITGGEGTYPRVTQSESQVWAQGNTVVALYNDSRTVTAGCVSGGSYSTDGGASWTNLNSRPFCPSSGDPAVVYDEMHGNWIAVFLGAAVVAAVWAAGARPTASRGPPPALSTRAPVTTASRCGWTTIPTAPSTGAHTSRGTASPSVAEPFRLLTPSTAGSRRPRRSTSRPHSSATSRSRPTRTATSASRA